MNSSFLFVGLGNVGDLYVNTRHNVGFIVLDKIAKHFDLEFQKKSNLHCSLASFKFNDHKVFFMKPETFMNHSGKAVSSVASFHKIEFKNIVVVYDDLDIESFKIKFSRNNSSGGHNGINSINQHCKNEYLKIRIGISRPSDKDDVSDYVLSNFSKFDLTEICKISKSIYSNIDSIISFCESKITLDLLNQKILKSK